MNISTIHSLLCTKMKMSQHIQGQFHDTESDEDSDKKLEIIVQDSEDEEIQLLVDQRNVDYSFLASLCESYAFHDYQGVGIVAN